MRKILIFCLVFISISYGDLLKGEIGINGDNKDNYSVFIDFKHFIPSLPNLRVAFDKTIKQESKNVIMYYNLLDKTFWLHLDIGAGINMAKENNALFYTKARINIPTTSFAIEIRNLHISSINTTELLARYTIMDGIIFDIETALGYRKIGTSSDNENVFLEFNFTL